MVGIGDSDRWLIGTAFDAVAIRGTSDEVMGVKLGASVRRSVLLTL